MKKYRCLRDVINKLTSCSDPDCRCGWCALPVGEIYSFIKGYTYMGQPGNHSETREAGVMFSNHLGIEHFISERFLKEHFEEVQ